MFTKFHTKFMKFYLHRPNIQMFLNEGRLSEKGGWNFGVVGTKKVRSAQNKVRSVENKERWNRVISAQKVCFWLQKLDIGFKIMFLQSFISPKGAKSIRSYFRARLGGVLTGEKYSIYTMFTDNLSGYIIFVWTNLRSHNKRFIVIGN